MSKVKIAIFVEGSNVNFIANNKRIATVWQGENSCVWRYRVEPANVHNWTDRGQDTAIDDVKYIIARELNRWGFSIEFTKY